MKIKCAKKECRAEFDLPEGWVMLPEYSYMLCAECAKEFCDPYKSKDTCYACKVDEKVSD